MKALFMQESKNTKIISVYYDYGNMKTASTANDYKFLAYMSLKRRR